MLSNQNLDSVDQNTADSGSVETADLVKKMKIMILQRA